MFSLFSDKNKNHHTALILDIQSGLVRGSIVLYKKGESAQVLAIATKSISHAINPPQGIQLAKKIIKIISEIVHSLIINSQIKNISSIHYIFSSPWIFSQLKTVKIQYEKEQIIKKEIIDKIISEELKKMREMFDDISNIDPVEHIIFELKLNGYIVSEYIDKMAKDIDISMGLSISPQRFLKTLNNSIEKNIHIKKQYYHSALIMQYTALNMVLDKNLDYTYVHIHDELTDIIVVKNGLCKHISSFPYGISTLLRKLSEKMNQTLEQSDSTVSLYQGKKFDIENLEKIRQNIEPLVNEWSELCIKSFTDNFDITHIPRTIYLSAHSHFDLFKEALIFRNDLNFDIIAQESIMTGDYIIFNKGVAQSNLMKMYALVINPML